MDIVAVCVSRSAGIALSSTRKTISDQERSASLQHGIQPFLRGWRIQTHHVIRLLIGVEGIPADRQADAVLRRFGNQGQAVIYLLPARYAA